MRAKGRVAEKGGLFWATKLLRNQESAGVFPGEMGGGRRGMEEGKGLRVPSK